jgi:ribosome biogenesis GTPase
VTTSPWWPADTPDAPESRLELLGWDAAWREAFDAQAAGDAIPARVSRVDRGACTTLAADGTVRALVPSRDLTPAVGDWTAVEPATPQSDAVLRAILPRRTHFTRHAAGEETAEQVVAANIDNVFIVNALDQRDSPRRVERYLALAWQSGANPVVVLTKADLRNDLEAAVVEIEAVTFGVPVHAVSARDGSGLADLDAYHARGETVALIGLSGAGKSTLINALMGEERMATADVREDGRGRHTTTHRELLPLPGGGVLIDTPGMRSVGLWEAEEGVEQTFADIEELAEHCRFSDCTHVHEPGCAVQAAIADGRLDAERLRSYEKLLAELRFQERKIDARARSDERKHWRALSKEMRQTPPWSGRK